MTLFPLFPRVRSFLLHVLLWTVTSLGSWSGMAVGFAAAGLLGFPYLWGVAVGSLLGSLVEIAWHLRLARRHRARDDDEMPPG